MTEAADNSWEPDSGMVEALKATVTRETKQLLSKLELVKQEFHYAGPHAGHASVTLQGWLLAVDAVKLKMCSRILGNFIIVESEQCEDDGPFARYYSTRVEVCMGPVD